MTECRRGRDQGPSSEDGTCLEALERLDAYLDAELDQLSAAEITRHLEECGGCGSEFERLRQVKTSVAASGNYLDPEVIERLRGFVREAIVEPDEVSGEAR